MKQINDYFHQNASLGTARIDVWLKNFLCDRQIMILPIVWTPCFATFRIKSIDQIQSFSVDMYRKESFSQTAQFCLSQRKFFSIVKYRLVFHPN
jgi:hypothetical protein